MVKVVCQVCKKEEDVFPSRAKKYKTCSKKCSGNYHSANKSEKEELICPICSEVFELKQSAVGKFNCCSYQCSWEYRKSWYNGSDNPNYKDGNHDRQKRISSYGYVLIFKTDHSEAFNDGYAFEHRVVMSDYLGRPLTKDEVVHHKDENKQNNDINNLELMSRSEHTKHHNLERGKQL